MLRFSLPNVHFLLNACMCRFGTEKLNLVATSFQASSDLLTWLCVLLEWVAEFELLDPTAGKSWLLNVSRAKRHCNLLMASCVVKSVDQ